MAARRRIGLGERRRMDDAGDRPAACDKRDRDRPVRIAGDERAGAVDRIDNEDVCVSEPPRIILGLFRSRARRNASTSRSACVTGEPPAL